jgi:hypothetical protein
VGGTVVGIGINFVDIDPIKALFWSAVINGVVAVPIMAAMMVVASRRNPMGHFTAPRGLLVTGWIATLVRTARSWRPQPCRTRLRFPTVRAQKPPFGSRPKNRHGPTSRSSVCERNQSISADF